MPDRKLCVFVLIAFFSSVSLAGQRLVVADLLQNAKHIENGLTIPWDGNNTSGPVITSLNKNLNDSLQLNIVHPKDYSLFLNDMLVYRNKDRDTLVIRLAELKKLHPEKILILTHYGEKLNLSSFKISIQKRRLTSETEVFDEESIKRKSSTPLIIAIGFFLIIGIVKVQSKREFDFYFSGEFLASPRLTIERFLSDSLNPFLILISVLLLTAFIYQRLLILNESMIDSYLDFDLNYSSVLTNTASIALLIVVFLFLKRSLYLFYSWLRFDIRGFSQLWRTYLLSFSNLCFWLFIFSELPPLLFPNLDFGNYFQILFFIFAALNAVGGIMTNLNFNIKADLISVSGILAIDVFPSILLVHLLTF